MCGAYQIIRIYYIIQDFFCILLTVYICFSLMVVTKGITKKNNKCKSIEEPV